MNNYWTLLTHGNPLATIQEYVGGVWARADLDGMLVPTEEIEPSIGLMMIEDPRLLKEVNPFKPLMTVNMARIVPEMLEEHPDERLGVLLRPCEMRALIEIAKRSAFEMERLLTICVDCLGTYLVEEYAWRVARKQSADRLSQDTAGALQFARQGGIAAYRYRAACQMCASPSAQGADLNIHVLGLPVRQQVLIQGRDVDIVSDLRLTDIAGEAAGDMLVRQHERTLAQLAERRGRTMKHITDALGEQVPKDIDALLVRFEECGECQRCLDACPICTMEFPRRSASGGYTRKALMRWLVSCAGCGMCEQACESHLPLAAIFGYIREKLDDELGYTPGRSLEEPLPRIS
jgi:formate dehydrogenase subunit beta